MKKVSILFFGLILLFVGCSNKEEVKTEDLSLKEIEKTLKENENSIKELLQENKELEKKVENLNKENSQLNEKISLLEKSDESINDDINKKYQELKNSNTNSTKVVSTNNYTISKNQLVGNWKYLNNKNEISFTNNNVEVYGNSIIYNGYQAVYYMYKDGKLYITDDGVVMLKK